VGDDSQAARYAALYPGEDLEHLSVPFGATLTWDTPLSTALDLGLAAEVASDPAGVEQRYINVDKPGATPSWLGNPGLDDPIRATARAALVHRLLRVEVFGSRIWSYPYLTRVGADDARYETYAGIGALLAGVNAWLDTTYLTGSLVWNWGEQTTDGSALAEIQPLTLGLTARTSRDGPVRGWLHAEIAASQQRVDTSLSETATDGWNRWDLGLDLAADHWTGSVVVINLFDELYTQHLSYLRNPFAAGVKVREPGRTLQVTAAFRY
jgi:iron complex outermembrane receptor protein